MRAESLSPTLPLPPSFTLFILTEDLTAEGVARLAARLKLSRKDKGALEALAALRSLDERQGAGNGGGGGEDGGTGVAGTAPDVLEWSKFYAGDFADGEGGAVREFGCGGLRRGAARRARRAWLPTPPPSYIPDLPSLPPPFPFHPPSPLLSPFTLQTASLWQPLAWERLTEPPTRPPTPPAGRA